MHWYIWLHFQLTNCLCLVILNELNLQSPDIHWVREGAVGRLPKSYQLPRVFRNIPSRFSWCFTSDSVRHCFIVLPNIVSLIYSVVQADSFVPLSLDLVLLFFDSCPVAFLLSRSCSRPAFWFRFCCSPVSFLSRFCGIPVSLLLWSRGSPVSFLLHSCCIYV